jgi:flagellar hook assembly protein FlgD
MNWSEYSTLKSGSKVSFAADKVTTKEAVEEVQDSDGKVVRAAEAKEEREFVVLAQKRWDGQTGEALSDSKSEYTLSQLESEKGRFDSEIARAKAQSDGLAAAIVDFKKV